MTDPKRPDELSVYRGRLLQVLRDVLGEPAASKVIALWDSDFSRTRPYAVIDLVNEAAMVLALEAKQRHDLRIALYKTLSPKAPGTARPPIASERPAEKARIVPFPASAAAVGPVAFEVFEAICQHMYDAVRDADLATPRQIAETMYRTLVVDYDKDPQAEAFVRWTAGQNDLKSLADAAADRYSLYAEKFHAALRELLGSALAERLRSHAVSAAASLPAAAHFSPARLLREA